MGWNSLGEIWTTSWTFLAVKVFFYFASSDVSFILHSLEEREGKGGDICCDPDVREFVCQGVSVLAMGSSGGFSSYDLAQLWRWIGNDLSSAWSEHLVFGQSRLRRSLGLIPFLSLQLVCSREHKGIRRRLWYHRSIACTFMGCRLLVCLRSGVTVLASVSSFALQALVCNLGSPYRRSSWEFSLSSLIRLWWIAYLGVITGT